MEDKSDIEILREFAKLTNRSIEVKELLYPRTGISTTQKYKELFSIPMNPRRTSFYIWFNDPYLNIGQSTIFSGAFIPLSSKIESNLEIRNRNILDKLNFFSKTKDNNIGQRHFDSKVVISGTIDIATKRLLSKSKIQKQILMALEMEGYFHISINQYKVDFIPELQDCSYFSIINQHGWEIEKGNIESLFNRIEKVRELIY